MALLRTAIKSRVIQVTESAKKKILDLFDGNKKSGIEFKALLKTIRKKRSKQKGNRKLIESQETMYNSRLC